MRALILAAGRGKRLRPLTDTTPKPLLPVGDFKLCEWQFAALGKAGVHEVVMNTAHLAEAFETVPSEFAAKGFEVAISREGDKDTDALESLGGIVKALPMLVPENDPEAPFLVLAGDVVHDFDLKRLTQYEKALRQNRLDAHLVAVPNPDFHVKGDMTVLENKTVVPGPGPHTYGCLMIVSPRIFTGLPAVSSKLFPWLWQFAQSKRLTAEVYEGFWGNIGSPEEYEKLIASRREPAYV
ncbi:MAG: nucleotidyltransferase family protein [Sutterellaceae bacterium]|nr:nucleotidyltransferase family protein [Sutterellaceae bacterium]